MTLLIKSTPNLGQSSVIDLVKTPVNPYVFEPPSGTFVAFSEFHLNTSKLGNIKVFVFSRDTLFIIGGISNFEVSKLKNSVKGRSNSVLNHGES
jgi:hypothetical protein